MFCAAQSAGDFSDIKDKNQWLVHHVVEFHASKVINSLSAGEVITAHQYGGIMQHLRSYIGDVSFRY